MTSTAMEAALSAPARNDWITANLETAMCLWEAALELRDRLPSLSAEWEEYGTIYMRHRIIALVAECEREWNDACAAGTETPPYDWEHCPRFLIRTFGPTTCPADGNELSSDGLCGFCGNAPVAFLTEDDGCPRGDHDCLGNNGDCHDACSTFAERAAEPAIPKGLSDESPLFRNTYHCPCGAHWEDEWDSGCDDECGTCGRTISPNESVCIREGALSAE